MRYSATFIAGCGLLQAQLGLSRPTNECVGQQPQRQAAYLISNEDENMVISLSINGEGMLEPGSMVATGGAGSAIIDGATNEAAAVDPLVSQSALTVAGKNLFAVNAGSNTVSMFSIDAADPTKLTMVGQPVKVPGEFPNTVAASTKNRMVCVGSTGATAGISCAPFSKKGGIGAMDALRPFDLGQTTPPVGPTNTVSQVFFSEDEKTLYTTVKGDPAADNVGFLAAFPVKASCGGGRVSAEAVMSSPSDTLVLFGSSIIPGSTDLLVTDASFGAAVLSVGFDLKAETKGRGAVEGQAATCWATVSPATNTAFVTDVGVNRLVEISLDDASILNEIDLSANGQSGMIDLAAAGRMVYVLAPGNEDTEPSVVVVNAETREQAQILKLGSMGVSGRVQGMAIFESGPESDGEGSLAHSEDAGRKRTGGQSRRSVGHVKRKNICEKASEDAEDPEKAKDDDKNKPDLEDDCTMRKFRLDDSFCAADEDYPKYVLRPCMDDGNCKACGTDCEKEVKSRPKKGQGTSTAEDRDVREEHAREGSCVKDE